MIGRVKRIQESLLPLLSRIDYVLLAFLLLLMNYRFSWKVAALVMIYVLRPRISYRIDGIAAFYLYMPVVAFVSYLFYGREFGAGYIPVALISVAIWLGCCLAYLQIRHAVAVQPAVKTHNALKALTVINFCASFIDFVKIVVTIRTINPYTQTSPPPFGISSGDLIGGAFGEMHLVNTIVSAILLIYFISRREPLFVFLSLIPFLLTGSNLATLIVLAVFVGMLFRKNALLEKHYVVCACAIMILFYDRVTPVNYKYLKDTLERIPSKLVVSDAPVPVVRDVAAPSQVKQQPPAPGQRTKEELLREYLSYRRSLSGENKSLTPDELVVAQARLEAAERRRNEDYRTIMKVVHHRDSLQVAKASSAFFDYGKLKKFDLDRQAGKLISFRQTVNYVGSDWRILFFGSGPGTFSSRMAFIASHIIADSRLLQSMQPFETPAFRENHKAIFRYLMFLDDETHSITNLPFAWYNTMPSEYGLAGSILFILLYAGFFIRRVKFRSAAFFICMSMLVFLMFDYWFERLSVMVFFELVALLILKQETEQPSAPAET